VSQPAALDRLYNEVLVPRLCSACGACVGNCPYLVRHRGRTVKLDPCARLDGRCYTYCPAAHFDPESVSQYVFDSAYDTTGLGNLLDVTASRSTSDAILAVAQGGGTVTSLMSMALEGGLIDAAILTSVHGSDGFAAGTVATTTKRVQECAGSKFVGAHTLEALGEALRRGFSRIGVVGLPCQVRSLRKMQMYETKNQDINGRVRLIVGLFCNWGFSAAEFMSYVSERIGKKEIRRCDVPPPPANNFIVETADGVSTIPLEELRPLIQGACQYCPDMTSEFADISVGMYEGRPGWNTLLIRSKVGAELVKTAQQARVLETEPFPAENFAHLRQASVNKKDRVSRMAPEAGAGS
jgi:coenzyme F420 hydrogenase subunit beta